MKRKMVLILIPLLCSVLVEITHARNPIYLPKNVENCLITFEKIGTTLGNDRIYIPHGTGFAIRDSVSGAMYAVTNRHIIDSRDSIFVRFNMLRGENVFGSRMTLRLMLDGKRTWVPHPDSSIDLAVVPLPSIKIYYIGSERLKSYMEVKLGDPVLFLGFPLLEAAIGDMNYPLVRSGIVSFKTSHDIVNPVTHEVIVESDHILIDGTIMSGNSGSPVLSIPKSGKKKITLIGVLSSHIFKINSGESYQLGICIPAERITEVINKYNSVR